MSGRSTKEYFSKFQLDEGDIQYIILEKRALGSIAKDIKQLEKLKLTGKAGITFLARCHLIRWGRYEIELDRFFGQEYQDDELQKYRKQFESIHALLDKLDTPYRENKDAEPTNPSKILTALRNAFEEKKPLLPQEEATQANKTLKALEKLLQPNEHESAIEAKEKKLNTLKLITTFRAFFDIRCRFENEKKSIQDTLKALLKHKIKELVREPGFIAADYIAEKTQGR